MNVERCLPKPSVYSKSDGSRPTYINVCSIWTRDFEKNPYYSLTGSDQDYRCHGLRGLLSKIRHLEFDPPGSKLMRIGLFFELKKGYFLCFYNKRMTEILKIQTGLHADDNEHKPAQNQEIYAEFIYLDLLEPINLDIDLLITRGQSFYQKR